MQNLNTVFALGKVYNKRPFVIQPPVFSCCYTCEPFTLVGSRLEKIVICVVILNRIKTVNVSTYRMVICRSPTKVSGARAPVCLPLDPADVKSRFVSLLSSIVWVVKSLFVSNMFVWRREKTQKKKSIPYQARPTRERGKGGGVTAKYRRHVSLVFAHNVAQQHGARALRGTISVATITDTSLTTVALT